MLIDSEDRFANRITATVVNDARKRGLVQAMVRIAGKSPEFKRAITAAAVAELRGRHADATT